MSTFKPGTFRIVDKLQRYGEDIQHSQLKYNHRRTLVVKQFDFSAAHHLHEYVGKCQNLHGHNYRVEVGISGYCNDIGLVVDFGDIKEVWKDHVETYLDHQYLNESLPPMNTSAENIALWVYEAFDKVYGANDAQALRVEFVRLWETSTSYAEVRWEWVHGE